MAASLNEEDQWVRLFDVSNPRRSFAGPTLYRVSSKVFPVGFPEASTEVVVWKRYSDFKKLHKDLHHIYTQQHKQDNFPSFPKGKYFGRFEDAVIEERKKCAFQLLKFIGNVPELFTSLQFVNFFEGGIPWSPSAMSPSVASSDGVSDNDEKENAQPPADRDDRMDAALEVGGVWLCKQPSLVEGLDSAGAPEDAGSDVTRPRTPEITDDFQPTLLEVPAVISSQNISDEMSKQGALEAEGEENENEISDEENEESDKEGSGAGADSEPTSSWLQRAISLCSEGDDLEVLASEADNDELDDEIGFPKAFSDVEEEDDDEPGQDLLNSEIHDTSSENFADVSSDALDVPSANVNELQENKHSSSHESQKRRGELSLSIHTETNSVEEDSAETWTEHADENKIYRISSSKINDKSEQRDDTSSSTSSLPSPEGESSVISSESDRASCGMPSDSNRAPCVITPHDDSLLSGVTQDDYLFVAAHTIRKALDCEVNGRYEQAFNLYRTCVSLLLKGVQGEKDVKRRDAVRRKTAQYLLKAEALYTAYVHELEKSEASSSDQDKNKGNIPEGSPSQSPRDIISAQESQMYKNVTLAELKVIGLVGKVMLVESVNTRDTFVIKVLHKSESAAPSRRNSKSGDHRRKRLLKRAYAICPYMVRLYNHYETASSVFLLLEYARGGRLWDYLSSYVRPLESQEYVLSKTDSQDIIHRGSSSSSSSSERIAVPIGTPEEEGPRGSNRCANEVKGVELKVISNENRTSKQRSRSPSPRIEALRTQSRDIKEGGSRKKGDISDGPRNGTSLLAKLDEYFNTSPCHVPEVYVRTWAAEVVLALAHLHSLGLVCRDLNPSNLLLDENGHILLTSFTAWDEVDRFIDETSRERRYCAPELSSVEEVKASADWWSLGVLIYELLMGKTLLSTHPWCFHSHSEIHFSDHVSAEAQAFIRELLRVTPTERLGSGVNGVEDIKSHPFFSSINWRELSLQSLSR